MEKKEFSIAEFDAVISEMQGAFSINDVIKKLGGSRSKAFRDRVERLLNGEGKFFFDGDSGYHRIADFFNGFEFLVTPDDWEIAQGILFPGHRFTPFLSAEVFPSEITFRNGRTEVPLKELTLPLGKVFRYHTLLGSDQVFDFLIAESAANAKLAVSARPGDPVTLGAFDLAEFYCKHGFSAGDALKCKVIDYEKGEVSFQYLSGERRAAKARREFADALDSALEQVIGRFEGYLDIGEQLSWAFYLGGETLKSAAASMDEYLSDSPRAEIRADGDHAILSLRTTVASAGDDVPELPEGIGVSRGETSDVGAILKEVGSILTPVEVESFILDQCSLRDLNYENFYSRAFGHGELHFADAGQEAVLMNFLEERFEYLTENYNRPDDEPKAPLRSRILDLVDARQELFQFLAEREKEPDHETTHLLHHLAEGALQLDEVLGMLNDPGFTPSPEELEHLEDLIDRREDEQSEIMESIENIQPEDGSAASKQKEETR